jgi:undecaprenyl-diphosphatase
MGINRVSHGQRRVSPILSFDTKGFLWVMGVTDSALMKQSARLVSRLGDGYLYVLIGAAVYLLEPVYGEQFLFAGIVAYAIELPLYLLLKNLIRRPRPQVSRLGLRPRHKPSDEFSFPSGHSAAAFLFAILLSAFYPWVMFPVFILAGLIGLSRVLLGVHYPSDIAAGILLGCGCALVALQF